MKIRPVRAEFLYAGERIDRRTDMTELTVAFRNFAKGNQNWNGTVLINWGQGTIYSLM
jgi:hypothetical protein